MRSYPNHFKYSYLKERIMIINKLFIVKKMENIEYIAIFVTNYASNDFTKII